MPSVDPARLAREIDRMLEQTPDPSSRAREAADLLERYAERARRKPGRPEDTLHTPRHVITALARSLTAETSDPDEGLALASALWAIPLRETRLLAADLLGVWGGVEVADWAEERAAETADLRILEKVARHGLAAWRNGDRGEAFRRAGGWLTAPSTRVRELGLLLLLSIVEAGESDDLRRVINLLGASPETGSGPERKTFARLLISLVRRSPREAARFLLDGVRRGNPAVSQIARQALPLLPARQQQTLEDALAHGEPSGIMPTS